MLLYAVREFGKLRTGRSVNRPRVLVVAAIALAADADAELVVHFPVPADLADPGAKEDLPNHWLDFVYSYDLLVYRCWNQCQCYISLPADVCIDRKSRRRSTRNKTN